MKYKDTDYLYATMRIRENERYLIGKQEAERMIAAKTVDEAARVLSEAGYGDANMQTIAQIEHAVADMRKNTAKLISEITDNRAISEVFLLIYDFHNIKSIIKAEYAGADAEELLIDSTVIPREELQRAMQSGDMRALPAKMSRAISDAREVIAHTGSPQAADFLLDRACFSMMADAAKRAGSRFICGYVRLLTDAANLRIAVRAARQGRSEEVLRAALISGGSVPTEKYFTAEFAQIFPAGYLAEAAAAGESAAAGRTGFFEFELLIENALIKYMESAKYAAFDERPLAAYIAARENEARAIRIILKGKAEKLSADEIRRRLSLSYV